MPSCEAMTGESWRDSSKKARVSVAHSDISEKATSSRRWDGGIAAEEEASAARGFRAARIAALAPWWRDRAPRAEHERRRGQPTDKDNGAPKRCAGRCGGRVKK